MEAIGEFFFSVSTPNPTVDPLPPQPIAQAYINDDIEALKDALEGAPEYPFKQLSNEVSFQIYFNKRVMVKIMIQASPDAIVEIKGFTKPKKASNMPADVQTLFDSLGDNLNSLNDLNEDRLSPLEYAKKMKAPQRIVDMLELLTVDEMKDCDDTEAAI